MFTWWYHETLVIDEVCDRTVHPDCWNRDFAQINTKFCSRISGALWVAAFMCLIQNIYIMTCEVDNESYEEA